MRTKKTDMDTRIRDWLAAGISILALVLAVIALLISFYLYRFYQQNMTILNILIVFAPAVLYAPVAMFLMWIVRKLDPVKSPIAEGG